MELYIYDHNMELLGIIDEIKALIWTRRYWECGEFSLLVPMTDRHAELIRHGRIIARKDADEAGQVRYVHVSKDADGLEQIEVKGRFLTHWIGKRMLLSRLQMTAPSQDILRRVVRENLTAPDDPRRAIEARGFDYGIVKTKVKDRKWTHWCRCRYIDYVDGGATAPAPAEPDKKPEAPATTAPDKSDAPLNLGTRVLSYKKGVKLMSGEDVRNVQKRLIQLGYNPGAADGMFGAKTEAAVRLFQTHAVIAIDGKVGPVTRLALLKK